MIHNIFWNYGFNVVVNSFLGFLTVVALVEFFMLILRVKQPRTKALCRTIPIFKLCFDLFLYNFSSWALMYDINPLNAEPGTRTLSAMLGIASSAPEAPLTISSGIQLLLQDGKTFTLADLVLFAIDPIWVKIMVSIGLLGSLLLASIQIVRIYKSYHSLAEIIKKSQPCSRPIRNQSLLFFLNKKKIAMWATSAVDVPCAFGIFKKMIVFPEKLLEELSQDEFEAVIAHEAAHLVWYDSIIRIASYFITSLFWWVPTKWWLSSLEQAQEKACDYQITAFRIPRMSLATAIVKSAKKAKTTYCYFPALCFIEKGRIMRRMQAILKETKPRKSFLRTTVQTLFVGGAMLAILFGKFWIF